MGEGRGLLYFRLQPKAVFCPHRALPGCPRPLTWSWTHSRSQVLWASTQRLGLSWLGHMPG